MQVRLRGTNRVTKRLADGSRVTYYYAWKGGPRLPGKPGDPEFLVAYHAAVATKIAPPADCLQSILNAYQDAPKFLDLAPRTRADYIRNIKAIEAEYGSLPIAALPDPATRGDMLDWRDRMARKSRRQADYVFATLAAILAWALDRGRITVNPCTKPGRLYQSDRADSIWTADAEDTLRAVAPPRIWIAYMMAVWTGQRQGDPLRLTWRAYDGTHIRLRQSKTGARVTIPIGQPLRSLLDAEPRRAVTILTTSDKTPWTSDGFRTSWRKACEKAGLIAKGIKGPTFHDIRGTAVTRLAIAGASIPEIATFTGHSLEDVQRILDAHYLGRDVSLAQAAISKRERHESGSKLPTVSPTDPDVLATSSRFSQ